MPAALSLRPPAQAIRSRSSTLARHLSGTTLARADRVLAALREIGLGDDAAVAAMRLWGAFVSGFVADELAIRLSGERRWPTAPELPTLSALGHLLGDAHADANFEAGLDLIVLAIATIAGDRD